MGRLEEEFPARGSSVVDETHTEGPMAAKEKLTEPVKQLSGRVTDVEDEVVVVSVPFDSSDKNTRVACSDQEGNTARRCDCTEVPAVVG